MTAQQTSVQDKITEVYSEYWAEVQIQDPQRIIVLTDLLLNRIEIIESPYDDGEKYLLLSTVPLFDKYNKSLESDLSFNMDTFNILKYDINFFTSYDQIFRIDGTNYIVYIKPQVNQN